jgi:hypothetical protein
MSTDLLKSPSEVLSLANIRNTLIRLEDTIIFCALRLRNSLQSWMPMLALIERAQFALNARIYDKEGFKEVLAKDNFVGSWLDWFLFQTEVMHGAPLSVWCTHSKQVSGSQGPTLRIARPIPFHSQISTSSSLAWSPQLRKLALS